MRWLLMVGCMVACTKEVVEEPLSGPGFDEATGAFISEGDQFWVGLTHMQVKNAPGPGGRFGDHASAVGNHLYETEPEGWLGAAFRNRGQLNWWTMTVWASEEDLTAFVISEPHVSAMVAFDDVAKGGQTRVLVVEPSELPMSWDRAMELLLADPGYVSGETKWRDGKF